VLTSAVGRVARIGRTRLLSLQSLRGPDTHTPSWQVSFNVQGLPSSQAVPFGTGWQVPVAELHRRHCGQDTFSAGSAFGTSGTPSALLVDEHGNVASELAVGAPGVLALATGQTLSMANDVKNGPAARPAPRKARRKRRGR
jgi:hypothetical protein